MIVLAHHDEAWAFNFVKSVKQINFRDGIATATKPVHRRCQNTLANARHKAEVRKRLTSDGSEIVGGTAAEFAGFLSADIAKWGTLAAEIGLKKVD